MIGEIIAIGDELTSGRILNTTSGYAARKLFDAGYTIHAMSTIGDTPALIGEALIQAIARVDFIIVTGGLGSTDDDITNEAVSRALERPTLPNLAIMAWVREHLKNSPSPDSPLEKLAWLPDGAAPFDPASRVAGYQLVHSNTPIFFLPGVPEEMQDLMSRIVLPKLAAWQAGSPLQTMQRVYKVFGIAESEINRRIKKLDLPEEIKIGYYPVYPDVHLSILIRSTDTNQARKRFAAGCRQLEASLGDHVYGFDGDDLESVVGRLLSQSKRTLCTAESCTGGLLAHRVTRVAGSSDYFLGGVVAYANELKRSLLDVPPETLAAHGAVSPETASMMAAGARARCGADISISITGIAGPSGGSTDKPVGTVYIGISNSATTEIKRFQFSGERRRIQAMAAHTGLDLLRRFLLRLQPPT